MYVCWYLRGGKMWVGMHWDAGGEDAGLGGGACEVVHSPGVELERGLGDDGSELLLYRGGT